MDDLPSKGHLIPDQEWFAVFDDLDDEVVNPLAAGLVSAEEAYMRLRQIISGRSRLMWQCSICGRVYIDDTKGKLQCYAPENTETQREVLRSHGNSK